MEKKLKVLGIIKRGFELGINNAGPIVVNTLLWIVTVWIPYLNIGTTIGLTVGVISKVSKGEVISMVEIFNPEYRKHMGNYFLTSAFLSIGVAAGFALFIIPGMVLALAWSLALLLAIDKGINPSEALTKSNELTYGEKSTMFSAEIVFSIIVGVVAGILFSIPKIGVFLALIVYLLAIFVGVGMKAYIYKELTKDM